MPLNLSLNNRRDLTTFIDQIIRLPNIDVPSIFTELRVPEIDQIDSNAAIRIYEAVQQPSFKAKFSSCFTILSNTPLMKALQEANRLGLFSVPEKSTSMALLLSHEHPFELAQLLAYIAPMRQNFTAEDKVEAISKIELIESPLNFIKAMQQILKYNGIDEKTAFNYLLGVNNRKELYNILNFLDKYPDKIPKGPYDETPYIIRLLKLGADLQDLEICFEIFQTTKPDIRFYTLNDLIHSRARRKALVLIKELDLCSADTESVRTINSLLHFYNIGDLTYTITRLKTTLQLCNREQKISIIVNLMEKFAPNNHLHHFDYHLRQITEILTPSMLHAVMMSPRPENTVTAIKELHDAHLLDDFYLSLLSRSDYAQRLADCVVALSKQDAEKPPILNAENRQNIIAQLQQSKAHHQHLISGLLLLDNNDLLRKDNVIQDVYFSALLKSRDPKGLARALIDLHDAHLLDDFYLNLLLSSDSPKRLADFIVALSKQDAEKPPILNTENRQNIIAQLQQSKADFHHHLINGLLLLDNNNLLRKDNVIQDIYFNALIDSKEPEVLAHAFIELNQSGLLISHDKLLAEESSLTDTEKLSKAYFQALLTANTKVSSVKEGIGVLLNKAWLNEQQDEHYQALINHRDLPKLLILIARLESNGFDLHSEQFTNLANHEELSCLSTVLQNLVYWQINTEDNIRRLISDMPVLTSSAEMRQIWNRIPRLSQEQFNSIAQIGRNPELTPINKRLEFSNYVNQVILGITEQARMPRRLNADAQSTHTASVHQSVSDSAIKLNELYGAQLRDDRCFQELLTVVENFHNNEQNCNRVGAKKIAAAKRFLQVTIAWHEEHRDSTSGVSTRELLQLVWLAIHDENQRSPGATFEDALDALINGLYEIQRGYNLSENGVDDNDAKDRPICVGGAFNKIIESQHSILKAVEIVVQNETVAALRLQVLVTEHLIRHLKDLPESSKESKEELIKELSESGITEDIWEAIKGSVLTRLFDEFRDLYRTVNNHELIELVDSGQYRNISKEEATEWIRSPVRTSQARASLFQAAADDDEKQPEDDAEIAPAATKKA